MAVQHTDSHSKKLLGRTIIVTGAGTGIGQGMAIALAKEGANIVIVGRTMEALQDTRAMLEATGAQVHIVQGSVAEANTATRATAEAVATFGQLHGVINNAHSFTPNLPLDQTPETDLRTHLESGLMGSFHFMKASFPHLKQRGGSIINFASQAGTQGWANFAPYAATKEAIRGLSRSASRDWGQYQIRINVISPASRSKISDEYLKDPEVMKATLARIPLGFIGDPELDIGRAAVFLMSDDSRYITGETLNVNGGM
jgi:NAD(P)-dependent dehydrogenase (short-subunit alcohol dehydrogenase family)